MKCKYSFEVSIQESELLKPNSKLLSEKLKLLRIKKKLLKPTLNHAAVWIKVSPESNASSKKMHTVPENKPKFSVYWTPDKVKPTSLK